MDLLDVLRRQAGRFQCPECGKSLADCRLDLVAQADAQSLVRVTCANCEHERLIAVAVAAPAEPAIAPVRDEPTDPATPGITTDEMLDVRLELATHEGDLKSLVG
ncbi:MAG: hypothetical protein M3Z11_12395 [Candidatus Dormibacteraeota bacterium]|nr:hypothetical protein [Candidatus Dormibacteraeota bacterium]